jgi:hypothetical protein
VVFETTDADLRCWQARDARALVAMLEAGHRNGLPPLRWSLGAGGGLVGDADGMTARVASQRAAFDAWVDYLGATRWPERTDSSGVTRLHALFIWHAGDRAKGVLRADIFPADGSELA